MEGEKEARHFEGEKAALVATFSRAEERRTDLTQTSDARTQMLHDLERETRTLEQQCFCF